MILYRENLKEYAKKLPVLISEFSKMQNIQKKKQQLYFYIKAGKWNWKIKCENNSSYNTIQKQYI